MAKAINFNTVKKEHFTVTLPDKDRTVLLISTPNKSLLTELITIKDSVAQLKEEINAETMDTLFDICAKLMSRNKGGVDITSEFLSEIFDLEDVLIFLTGYMEYVQGLASSKN